MTGVNALRRVRWRSWWTADWRPFRAARASERPLMSSFLHAEWAYAMCPTFGLALRRTDAHRLGMAVRICTVRYIGRFPPPPRPRDLPRRPRPDRTGAPRRSERPARRFCLVLNAVALWHIRYLDADDED